MPLALLGVGVSKGVAIGEARLLQAGQPEITEYVLPGHLIPEELRRFERAVEAARSQLQAICGRIPDQAPDGIASFIETHLLMLDDPTLTTVPLQTIRERGCNAEWALHLQEEALVQIFDEMDDAYLKTRRDDVEHVVRRIQHHLASEGAQEAVQEEAAAGDRIYLAQDLSPGDLVLLHQQGAVGVVTEFGTPMSHTAILARSLGVPMVVGVRRAYHLLRDGETVVVDGSRGSVFAGLDRDGLDYYHHRQRADRRARNELRRLKDEPARTRDGTDITLYANIELSGDLAALRKVGAAGVGLYRTEFLYLNRERPPDEEEQYRAYRQVVRRLQDRPLTIRTLDLGVDKWPGDGASLGPNPALGLRAVRFCLQDPELFLAQLRAILRASAHGPVRILVPMLCTLGELRQVQELLEEARAQLRQRGQKHAADVPLGGMIEVPAAAVCADHFAQHLDFFSIGTNDLIQYTVAADRMDDQVNYLFDPMHPAVLRLIRMVLDAANGAGIPVAMCGEMAGDPLFTRLLLGLGLTEFSAPPTSLLEVKRVINDCHLGELRPQVDRILAGDPGDLRDGIEQLNEKG